VIEPSRRSTSILRRVLDQILKLVQVFEGLLTPMIAITVAYIAYRQWQADKLKLAMERYDRRIRIYKEVAAFIAVTCRDFKPAISEVLQFARATAEADFLFPSQIRNYLDELRKRAIASQLVHNEYRDMTQPIPPGYDHQRVVNEMHEHSLWFVAQFDVALEKFRPYLNLND
jgi:hypothetical protein